jgi:hypothetical protein
MAKIRDAGCAYLPACCTSLMGLTGGLIGTKRVSLLPEARAFDARKMASNRNINISDSMVVLPGSGASLWAQRARLWAHHGDVCRVLLHSAGHGGCERDSARCQ